MINHISMFCSLLLKKILPYTPFRYSKFKKLYMHHRTHVTWIYAIDKCQLIKSAKIPHARAWRAIFSNACTERHSKIQSLNFNYFGDSFNTLKAPLLQRHLHMRDCILITLNHFYMGEGQPLIMGNKIKKGWFVFDEKKDWRTHA